MTMSYPGANSALNLFGAPCEQPTIPTQTQTNSLGELDYRDETSRAPGSLRDHQPRNRSPRARPTSDDAPQ
jgi:hypothetical protein